METTYTDALTDFVDALDVKEEVEVKSETPDQACDQSGGWTTVDEWSCTREPSLETPEQSLDNTWSTTPEPAVGNTWWSIEDTFDNWLTSLIDIERRISTSKSLKGKHISQSIDGMLRDGLIGICEASELRYIGNCWTRLMNAHTLYSAGCHSYKYDILSTLLDLYSAKQITKELCIEICEQL